MERATIGWSVKVWLAAARTGVTPFVDATVIERAEKSAPTVPLSTPDGESVRPEGSDPEVTAKTGAGWPAAVKVCE